MTMSWDAYRIRATCRNPFITAVSAGILGKYLRSAFFWSSFASAATASASLCRAAAYAVVGVRHRQAEPPTGVRKRD
jgi:hypothetical protein